MGFPGRFFVSLGVWFLLFLPVFALNRLKSDFSGPKIPKSQFLGNSRKNLLGKIVSIGRDKENTRFLPDPRRLIGFFGPPLRSPD